MVGMEIALKDGWNGHFAWVNFDHLNFCHAEGNIQ